MPRLTEASIARRRGRIVGAAMRCFLARGFAGTSVDDVCAEAGISKGAFYSHYASKEALVHDVMAVRSSELGPPEGDTIEALADAIYAGKIAPTLPRENGRFGLEAMAASTYDEVLRGYMIDNLETMRTGIERAIERLVAAGAARPGCDPAGAARIVAGFVLGTISEHAIWRGESEAEMRASLRLLLRALLAP